MGRGRLPVLAGAMRDLLTAEARRAMGQQGAGASALSRSQRRARDVRHTLEHLGPFYIKVGQILSTRPDIVSDDMISELRKLHDRVSVQPFSLFRPVLEAELGTRWTSWFRDIDAEHPLGAASLAQVYAVTLTDGTPAVVKVQRPGVDTLMRTDMALLQRIVKLISGRFPRFSAVVDLPAMLGIVFDTMKAELDFMIEAQNMARARSSVGDYKYLDIPEVVHVTRRVMIQTRAPGCSIRDADPRSFRDEERVGIGRDLLRYMYRSYFSEKFFHADPHPGNIFVHPGEKASLIDWGMVGRIDRRTSVSLMLVLMNLAMNDGAGVARAWIEFGHPTTWADIPSFIHDMEALVPKVADASLEQLNFGVTLTKVLTSSTQRSIRTNPMIAVLGKSFANLEGSVRYLAPELSITEVFQDDLLDMVSGIVDEFTSLEQLARTALETIALGTAVMEQGRGVLKDTANRQFTLQINRANQQQICRTAKKYIFLAVAGLVWSRRKATRT